MNPWPPEPPSQNAMTMLPILRTPAAIPLKMICLSHEIQGALTHFTGGRTLRCTQNGCPCCEHHILPRWYGYIGVTLLSTNSDAIYEFPASPYDSIRTYIKKYGSLRGMRITAYRQPKRENGPVFLNLFPPPDPAFPMDDPPDVFRHLCRIWHLDYQAERKQMIAIYEATAHRDGPFEPDPQHSSTRVSENKSALTTQPKTPSILPNSQKVLPKDAG